MTLKEVQSFFKTEKFASILVRLYGDDELFLKRVKKRYNDALKRFTKEFNITNNISMFTSSGRVELVGNHTDHNNGLVVGASINRDMIAIASPIKEDKVIIFSEGFKNRFVVTFNELKEKSGDGTTILIKGLLDGLFNNGYKIGGFSAYVTSDIAKGSGISSSASFEMLILSILSSFYNSDKLDILTMAKIGQYAENFYWGKPSGLLDQLTTSYGGVIAIDFKNKEDIKIEKLTNIFTKNSYNVVLVNTGSSHADLTDNYSSIVTEMKSIASLFGKKSLRETEDNKIIKSSNKIRKEVGDRALLRAIHYYEENKRVKKFINAVKKDNFDSILELINESGSSSWKLLQNCYLPNEVKNQNIPVALTLTELFLKDKVKYASRVHGGGFAGVILVVLPVNITKEYCIYIESFFGKMSSMVMSIRDIGAININNLF